MTKDELIQAYWWPFPPEEGWMYDFDALQHWIEATTEPAASTFGDQRGLGPASKRKELKSSVDPRLLTVGLAAVNIISQAIAVERTASLVGEHADAVRATNLALVNAFVDGVIASPPVVEPVDALIWPVVIRIHVVFPPPPPPEPHPEWEVGELLSATTLTALAIRFQTAAVADVGGVGTSFEVAADRLLEAADQRRA